MPILDAHTLEFFSRSPDQTRRVGMRIGVLLQPGDVICLEGELGAGKTTFTQGLAQGWGTLDTVSSPTFIIINAYRRAGKEQLFHMDAYRLDSTPEAAELDLDEMLALGALIIEWPERIESILPGDRLWFLLEHVSEEHRRIFITAQGERFVDILNDLRQDIFGGD